MRLYEDLLDDIQGQQTDISRAVSDTGFDNPNDPSRYQLLIRVNFFYMQDGKIEGIARYVEKQREKITNVLESTRWITDYSGVQIVSTHLTNAFVRITNYLDVPGVDPDPLGNSDTWAMFAINHRAKSARDVLMFINRIFMAMNPGFNLNFDIRFFFNVRASEGNTWGEAFNFRESQLLHRRMKGEKNSVIATGTMGEFTRVVSYFIDDKLLVRLQNDYYLNGREHSWNYDKYISWLVAEYTGRKVNFTHVLSQDAERIMAAHLDIKEIEFFHFLKSVDYFVAKTPALIADDWSQVKNRSNIFMSLFDKDTLCDDTFRMNALETLKNNASGLKIDCFSIRRVGSEDYYMMVKFKNEDFILIAFATCTTNDYVDEMCRYIFGREYKKKLDK